MSSQGKPARYGGTQWKPRHVKEEHPRAADERRIVAELGKVQLEKLAERRHHGSWDEMTIEDDWSRLDMWLGDELSEFVEALDRFNADKTPENFRSLSREVGDVANILAIVMDIARNEVEQ